MKKKNIETILYSVGGVIALLLIIVVANFIISTFTVRADLTAEKQHTLSNGTRAILGKISKLEEPLEIRFYCSKGENADVMLKSYGQHVEDLLNEYRRMAKGKIEIKKLDPQPDSEAEDSARADGVEPQTTQRNGEPFYLGVAINLLDKRVTLPTLTPDREKLLEYDLSRAVSRVIETAKPVIGIMSGLPVFGQPANPMMMQMGQQGKDPWVFISELKQDFEVKQVELDSEKIDDDIKVLLVVYPKGITDKGQFAIDQFLMRGGKVIGFVDAFSLADSSGQNPMMGQMGGGSATLEKLFKAWGVQFDTTKVVADMTFTREIGGRDGRAQIIPTFLFLNAEGINSEEAVTAQMDNILLPFAGTFSGTPAAGLKQTILLKSSPNAQLVEGFMASLSPDQVSKDFKSANTSYPLAIRLSGKFKTAFPDGKPESKEPDPAAKDSPKPVADKKADASLKESTDQGVVVLVGDADFLGDQFSVRVQNFFGQKIISPFNANLILVQNLVEQMAGDSNLIGVRTRASLSRPFTRVKKMEEKAQENYRSKIKEMEGSLAETELKLGELQNKKDGNQKFILSPEQQAEVESFRKKQTETRKELKVVRKQLRQDIDSLETRLKWANIGGMPLLVILAGMAAALWKNNRRK